VYLIGGLVYAARTRTMMTTGTGTITTTDIARTLDTSFKNRQVSFGLTRNRCMIHV
jgi:hypothetical protein